MTNEVDKSVRLLYYLHEILYLKRSFKSEGRGPVPQVTPQENAMANAFWVSVRNNISKRWNTTDYDGSKNQSSADSAIRLPNASILNSNAADITEYFLDVYQTTLY
ncbi:hypothetical protein TNCV_3926041 [Trichonephila clavipes]|nr:hypothetical protein TNCV_3926041 [Trichonephila clavipes]